MDVSQYLEIFIDETKEHLQSLNTSILALEQDPSSMDTVNEIFRAAHSLKGMAGTMGFKRMQALTHDMENVFSEVRNGTFAVSAEIIDVLFQCLDALDEYLNNIQSTADEGTNENKNLIDALNGFLNSKGGTGSEAKADTAGAKEESAASSDKDKKLLQTFQDLKQTLENSKTSDASSFFTPYPSLKGFKQKMLRQIRQRLNTAELFQ